MLRDKTCVADGRLSRIGSTNLNYASLLWNWELDVLIDHPEIGKALEQRFRKDVTASREVVLREPLGQERLRAWLPPKIARPGAPVEPMTHRATRRERTRRTFVTLYSVAAGAGRSLFLPGFVAVLLLGLAAFFLPRVVAGGVTLVALWLAQSGARQLHRGGPQGSTTRTPPA
jgi:cardiolipin synthase